MRKLVVVAILTAALGCSNETKNSDPNNQSSDGGWDLAGSNNGTTTADMNPNNVVVDVGPPPADIGSADIGNTDTGPVSDVGSVDGGGPDMSIASPCPADTPPAGGACDMAGLECEYGDDPRDSCRTRAVCTDGSWAITAPRCTPLPTTVCPMTRDEASGELCDVMDAYCVYEGLNCHCTNCVDGPVVMCAGDPTWMCEVANPDAECPAAKPRLGDGCANDGKSCNYKCGPEGGRVCRAGSWRAADGGPCPISTAQVKRDIEYLSAAEINEISQALQSIPLAHYHYTDPSIGRGQKLGFIIEDLPASTPAVDQQRMMVDLYGYTSMLVADAQARERRMRELEARLEQLEAKAQQCGE